MFNIQRLIGSVAVLVTAAVVFAGTEKQDSSSRADSALQGPKPTRQYGLLGLGTAGADPAALNTKLKSMGLSEFDSYGGNLAFTGHTEFNRVILEGGVDGLFWDDQANDALQTTLLAGNLSGNIGGNILPAGQTVNLWPFAGLGLGVNYLRIRNKEKTLTQALASMEPDVKVVQAAFLISAGLAADFVFPNKDKKKGFVMGLRGGYTYGPAISRWNMDDIHITDIPDFKQSGAFFRVVLGGWGPKRHHHDCDRW
jgi:hypothetical protein